MYHYPQILSPVHDLAQRMSSSVFTKGRRSACTVVLRVHGYPLHVGGNLLILIRLLTLLDLAHALHTAKGPSISAAIFSHPPDRLSFDMGGWWGLWRCQRVQRLLLGESVSEVNG